MISFIMSDVPEFAVGSDFGSSDIGLLSTACPKCAKFVPPSSSATLPITNIALLLKTEDTLDRLDRSGSSTVSPRSRLIGPSRVRMSYISSVPIYADGIMGRIDLDAALFGGVNEVSITELDAEFGLDRSRLSGVMKRCSKLSIFSSMIEYTDLRY
jgi:hypothetical protein